jgi:hypothetical protein
VSFFGGRNSTGVGFSPSPVFPCYPSLRYCCILMYDCFLSWLVTLIRQHIIASSVYKLRSTSLIRRLADCEARKLIFKEVIKIDEHFVIT